MNDERVPRAEIVIDLGAIRHNVRLLVDVAAASGAQTMTVVKADGYGHGAPEVAAAAVDAGATWLGTCFTDEALTLRRAGIDVPVLAWLHAPGTDFRPAVAAGVDLSVSDETQLAAVVTAARDTQMTARVHLEIDTGLCRGGATPGSWRGLVASAATAARTGAIEVIAVCSHLACADQPGHPSIDTQARRFDGAYLHALDAGLHPLRHLANSAATLTRPDLRFDIVRTGIATYGLSPVRSGHALIPAMTFRSSVVLTRRVAAGESVSYGHTWTAREDTTLALVPVGYADGVPRALSNTMDVLLAGKRRPIAGRICMDQLVVDCGDEPVACGDEVVLFGTGEHGEPTAREWADTVGTIGYEIVTGMYRPRVRRRYVGWRP